MIYRVLYIYIYIPGGAGCLPSTVSLDQDDSVFGTNRVCSKERLGTPNLESILVASYVHKSTISRKLVRHLLCSPTRLRYIWWWHIPRILPVKHQFGKLHLTSLVWPNQFYPMLYTFHYYWWYKDVQSIWHMVGSNLVRSEYYNSQTKYMSRKPSCSYQGSISVAQRPLLLAMLGLQVWWRKKHCACCGKGTTATVTRGCRWRCIWQSIPLRRRNKEAQNDQVWFGFSQLDPSKKTWVVTMVDRLIPKPLLDAVVTPPVTLNIPLNVHPNKKSNTWPQNSKKSAGLAGVSSEVGLDDGLLVCT